MADDAAHKTGPFDVQTIKYLVALMSRHDLAEIDLREGDLRIRLRRNLRGDNVLPPAAAPQVPAPAPPAAAPAPPEAVKSAPAVHVIKAPTPGTFYTSPNPGAEPFVRVGSRVTPTTVVGLIEAMKLFNEITADCTGVIREVLVENQQPVEFGQPLFTVDLTA
ncbi:MAG TPA: acetyl-CoA carboxylase biotin carboxyl carrier protein [Gemmataceae bacterium]|nr:acetyl-CoA carboxylase biotin carboxyl carrier protein [Gemmataceae bacterium]